ncbi:MAG: hypothetical protein ACHQ01_01615 [Candidatus Limnocylindrales bacterium]
MALLGAVLLVGCALAGCGPSQATTAPTAPQATASHAPSGPVEAGTGAGPSASSTAPPSTSATPTGQATPDPVASELDQINQLINDIDNSVQSSDSSQQGGE